KKKVIEEQAAHDLLTIQTLKNKSPVDQFIFHRHTPMSAEASRPTESPSLDAELALTDRKTNAEVEVQSMVSVLIHQDTSSVPPMTTLVIDLMTSQSGSPLPTSSVTTSIVMTTTTIPPPPPQP
nr:hypothetical protein [Tanacetum cinerariifolium]